MVGHQGLVYLEFRLTLKTIKLNSDYPRST